MPIEANVTNQQITASVGETKIDVSVSGGVGPTGATGAQGPQGTSGASSWDDISGKPLTFTPSSHTHDASAITSGTVSSTRLPIATTTTRGAVRLGDGFIVHPTTGAISVSTDYAATGHSHAIADVTGLQTALDGKQAAGSYAAASHTHDASAINAGTLAAARLPASVVQRDGSGTAIVEALQIGSQAPAAVLFNEGSLSAEVGGIAVLFADASGFGVQVPLVAGSGISCVNDSGITGVADLVFTDQTTQTTAWTGSIAASAVTSGTLDIARLPTGATSTTVAVGSHAHGNLTSTGSLGSQSGLVVVTGASGAVGTLAQGTAGQVLRVNSTATGVEWGTAGASAAVDVRSDTVAATTYTGRAAAGSATSALVWKIRRTVLTSAGAVSSTATATSVRWDDRLTASYS